MKILLTSDTHYGFSDKTDKIMRNFIEEVAQRIDEDAIEYCLHAGDVSSHKSTQIRDFWKLWHDYVSVPTYWVTGNHDYWDMKGASIDEFHKNIGVDDGVAGAMLSDEVNLFYFNGFYGNTRPPTQDRYRMGNTVFDDLQRRSYKDFKRILSDAQDCKGLGVQKQILLTHYPLYTNNPLDESFSANRKWWDEIPGVFDIVCQGHNHKRQDEFVDGVRILNAGSDYDKPKYLIFEV